MGQGGKRVTARSEEGHRVPGDECFGLERPVRGKGGQPEAPSSVRQGREALFPVWGPDPEKTNRRQVDILLPGLPGSQTGKVNLNL